MKVDTTEANENMDMPAHERTYNNFMMATKYGTGIIVLILLMLLFFLVL